MPAKTYDEAHPEERRQLQGYLEDMKVPQYLINKALAIFDGEFSGMGDYERFSPGDVFFGTMRQQAGDSGTLLAKIRVQAGRDIEKSAQPMRIEASSDG